MSKRVLVVDDDARFRRVTTIALETAGYAYEVAGDVEQANTKLETEGKGAFDAILLDVDMPDGPGWSVLEALRASGNETPVLFVTGKESVEDRVRGLRLGADDYVVKPVAYEELIARIEAVLRRHASLPDATFGDLVIDRVHRRVERNGKSVDLSPKEFDLLAALVEADGAILSRERLLKDVWQITFDPGTNVVDVHVGRLRKKLDRHGPLLIETVRGQGYRIQRHAPQPS